MEKDKAVTWLLSIGLAFAFLYVAISSWLNPDAWIGFVPLFVQNIIPENLIHLGLSLTHIGVGVWLLTPYKKFYAAIVSGVLLLGIVVFNLGAMDIVFRDVSLVLMAAALAVFSKK